MITDVAVRDAGPKGKGVFALRPFRKGEFIFRRRHGRTVTGDQIPSLSDDERDHLCELDLDRSAVLVGAGRYLNHSCEPNAMRRGVKVFAWRPIREGEEITIDYRLNAFAGEVWPCLCGHCSGSIVGSFFALDESRQRAYLPHAPAFIRRQYRTRNAPERRHESNRRRIAGAPSQGRGQRHIAS